VNSVYLGLGSNLGDRAEAIRQALGEIDQLEETQVIRVSSLYDTDPVGVDDQPPFLNAVVHVETDQPPARLLWNLKRIERRLGRTTSRRWGPRVIDLDILLYADQVIDDAELTIPHRGLRERAFVLVPLTELAPELVLPDTGERVTDVRGGLSHTDEHSVRRLGRPSY